MLSRYTLMASFYALWTNDFESNSNSLRLFIIWFSLQTLMFRTKQHNDIFQQYTNMYYQYIVHSSNEQQVS